MTDLQTYLTKIKEMEAEATRLPLILNRYDEGGGRCFKKEPLTLVCDFYHQEDRELFFELRNIAVELVEVALAAEEVDSIGKYEIIEETESKIHNLTTKLTALKQKIAGLGEG